MKNHPLLLILLICWVVPNMAHAEGKGSFYLSVWAVMIIPTVVSLILVGKGLRIFWTLLSLLVCSLSAAILLSGAEGFLHFIGFALPILLIPFSVTANRIMSRISAAKQDRKESSDR